MLIIFIFSSNLKLFKYNFKNNFSKANDLCLFFLLVHFNDFYFIGFKKFKEAESYHKRKERRKLFSNKYYKNKKKLNDKL